MFIPASEEHSLPVTETLQIPVAGLINVYSPPQCEESMNLGSAQTQEYIMYSHNVVYCVSISKILRGP